MIRRSVDTVIGTICLACIGYVYFFVPVGQRTLFEHTMRIAATEPAQELGRDATTTAHTLGAHVLGEIDRLTTDGGVPDGAAPSAVAQGGVARRRGTAPRPADH